MTPTDAPDLLVRRAEPDEAPTVAQLHLAAREAAFPAIPRSPHPPEGALDHFARRLADPDCQVWLAETAGSAGPAGPAVHGDPVAYLMLSGEWLDDLYVRPDLTGHGIGGALLDLAKELSPAGFDLWVFVSNERARRFYERHGLVEVERTDGSDNDERAPDVRMRWPGLVEALRARMDAVDDSLADLLAQRAALTGRIQLAKQVGGQEPGAAGRDAQREAEIVRRMAERAPALGQERLSRIMHTVISESLDAARERGR